MKRFAIIVCLMIALTSLYSGCEKKQVPVEANQEEWEQIISHHTSGYLSKKSNIKVQFVNEVIAENQIGNEVADAFTFEPHIPGKAYWSKVNELVFVPNQELSSGEEYDVQLNLEDKIALSDHPAPFKFVFSVKSQAMEINVDGLSAVSLKDLINQKLTGDIVVADYEENDNIEKVLKATQDGDELKISWTHSQDGLKHRFLIEGIKRKKARSTVELSWNASSIGVDKKGTREIAVPKQGTFEVLEAVPVVGKQQYIKIRFSDPLDPNQNLRGLITYLNRSLKFKIENNVVKAYPSSVREGLHKLRVYKGIKNIDNIKLAQNYTFKIRVMNIKPGAKFVGKGVILPKNEKLTIPFEAVNLNSVQVTAFEVFSKNIGQFLQVNQFNEHNEMKRVGRYIWRKTIVLNSTETELRQWTRYAFDATELFEKHPNSLIQFTISFNKSNSAYPVCSEGANDVPAIKEPPIQDEEGVVVAAETSAWDYSEDYDHDAWNNRNNPCHNGYYNKSFNKNVESSRNYIVSDIGIISKMGGDNRLHVVTSNIGSATPLPEANFKVFNYQNMKLASGVTDKDGFANVEVNGVPFYLVAEKDGQKGYIKLNTTNSLPISHFDIGGEVIKRGIKGYIYGERGVWRPGDDIFLTFVLEDKKGLLPASHPVSIDFFNPRGQLIHSSQPTRSLKNFHFFGLKTDNSAPTGNWKATVKVGGINFDKTIKVETVVPNRLKIELDVGEEALTLEDEFQGTLFAQWLHGAKASWLEAKVFVSLSSRSTRFNRYTDYTFDDPTRTFPSSTQYLYEGSLDEDGNAEIIGSIELNNRPPGMLTASFNSRVFEESGAFSADSVAVPMHAYSSYVGIKTPKGDAARGMLLTDTKHKVSIATLNNKGEPISSDGIDVTIYKISWKWWWDKTSESLANFAYASSTTEIQSGTISTKNGVGEWEFEIKYPSWGRYLIRAIDRNSGHSTAKIVYVDWPGWAGRAMGEKGVGASTLNFTTDKKKYKVGEEAVIHIPSNTQGRALLSLENGTGVVKQSWIPMKEGENQFKVPITQEMSPNIYAYVTLLQPHKDKKNDRPIRLYGVIPIMVDDPATVLVPVLDAPDQMKPRESTVVKVKEENGKPFVYTIAIVDEGLLGLTRFSTPNLRNQFYKREANGVKTWDIFDEVVGAYGGELERLLALGGGGTEDDRERAKRKRFPPVVQFLGPFELKANSENSHEVKLPQYIGAVRMMVVAGNNGAYGLASKTVPVKQPLMLLATLPRVLGPEEELFVPVSVFALEPTIKTVKVKIEAENYFETAKETEKSVSFEKPGDKIVFFRMKVNPKIAKGKIKFVATAGPHKAEQEVFIDIRSPNPKTVKVDRTVLEPGEEWKTQVIPHGMQGTNKITLELSSIPSINLEKRLGYLMKYPHGCIEQTVSSVFPQLYLSRFIQLTDSQKKEIEKNVNAGIERLSNFQLDSGGFSYWPGSHEASDWGTSYAGHFLIEAQKAGYFVRSYMLSEWKRFQNAQSMAWTAGTERSELVQAYRLYTLALNGTPSIGIMNRLREAENPGSTVKWMLATAYHLASQPEAAEDLVAGDSLQVKAYQELGNTYGSDLRDRAIILVALSKMGQKERAAKLATDISEELSSDRGFSTQTTAYSLLALAEFLGTTEAGDSFEFEMTLGMKPSETFEFAKTLFQKQLQGIPLVGDKLEIKNTNSVKLFVNLVREGVPVAGEETAASNGLEISSFYSDLYEDEMDGVLVPDVDPTAIDQGVDFISVIDVKNTSDVDYENIVLTHIVPSGWEIHNHRFTGTGGQTPEVDYQDIRDDRIYSYFSLKAGETKRFKVLLNASYLGRFYLPGISAEAMYDSKISGNDRGWWVEVHNDETAGSFDEVHNDEDETVGSFAEEPTSNSSSDPFADGPEDE